MVPQSLGINFMFALYRFESMCTICRLHFMQRKAMPGISYAAFDNMACKVETATMQNLLQLEKKGKVTCDKSEDYDGCSKTSQFQLKIKT